MEGLQKGEYESWKRDPTTKKVIAALLKIQTSTMEDWANGRFAHEDLDAFNRGRLSTLFEFTNLNAVDGG